MADGPVQRTVYVRTVGEMRPVCALTDCGRPLLARGYCSRHYEQMRRGRVPWRDTRHRRRRRAVPRRLTMEGTGYSIGMVWYHAGDVAEVISDDGTVVTLELTHRAV